jgi:hypothetical protein
MQILWLSIIVYLLFIPYPRDIALCNIYNASYTILGLIRTQNNCLLILVGNQRKEEDQTEQKSVSRQSRSRASEQ